MLAGDVIDNTSAKESMQCCRMSSGGESQAGSIWVMRWNT